MRSMTRSMKDFLLIIDDYHLLDDVPVISGLVNRFLELVVENCHVILLLAHTAFTGRRDRSWLRANRWQVLIMSNWRSNPGEVRALYAQNHHKRLSDETAKEFVVQTGGWITGMVLSNLPGMPRVSGVDTFAYLGQQVLYQQPEHIREFLLRTSLLDEFNAEFCGMISGPLHPDPPNWYDLMSLILEKNLFVLPLDSDGRWLRYHPLFREFLQDPFQGGTSAGSPPHSGTNGQSLRKIWRVGKAYFTCRQLDDPDALADVIESGRHCRCYRARLSPWTVDQQPAASDASRPVPG
ncbi:MAG: hypothetical protein MZU91_02115 [Desulfosudis oleivorans]|nr:hypothetical protein [Desulfosudis oleivorans]